MNYRTTADAVALTRYSADQGWLAEGVTKGKAMKRTVLLLILLAAPLFAADPAPPTPLPADLQTAWSDVQAAENAAKAAQSNVDAAQSALAAITAQLSTAQQRAAQQQAAYEAAWSQWETILDKHRPKPRPQPKPDPKPDPKPNPEPPKPSKIAAGKLWLVMVVASLANNTGDLAGIEKSTSIRLLLKANKNGTNYRFLDPVSAGPDQVWIDEAKTAGLPRGYILDATTTPCTVADSFPLTTEADVIARLKKFSPITTIDGKGGHWESKCGPNGCAQSWVDD